MEVPDSLYIFHLYVSYYFNINLLFFLKLIIFKLFFYYYLYLFLSFLKSTHIFKHTVTCLEAFSHLNLLYFHKQNLKTAKPLQDPLLGLWWLALLFSGLWEPGRPRLEVCLTGTAFNDPGYRMPLRQLFLLSLLFLLNIWPFVSSFSAISGPIRNSGLTLKLQIYRAFSFESPTSFWIMTWRLPICFKCSA